MIRLAHVTVRSQVSDYSQLSNYTVRLQCCRLINNGNRTEWSPIRSVIIWVINKIGRPRSGSPICKLRVWLQTELDDTKSCYQLIIIITIFEKQKSLIWKMAFDSNFKYMISKICKNKYGEKLWNSIKQPPVKLL